MTRQVTPLPLGSVVDVVGFADDHAYAAVLEDAQFLATGQTEQIVPKKVSHLDAISVPIATP